MTILWKRSEQNLLSDGFMTSHCCPNPRTCQTFPVRAAHLHPGSPPCCRNITALVVRILNNYNAIFCGSWYWKITLEGDKTALFFKITARYLFHDYSGYVYSVATRFAWAFIVSSVGCNSFSRLLSPRIYYFQTVYLGLNIFLRFKYLSESRITQCDTFAQSTQQEIL